LAPFGQAVSEEKIFLTLANQKLEAQWAEPLVFFTSNILVRESVVFLRHQKVEANNCLAKF
jgi:hypothetical protein